MNSFQAIGRLVATPEVKFLESGKVVCSAVASVPKGNGKKNEKGYPDTDLLRFEVWGKSGEVLGEKCAKGDVVWFRGRLDLMRAQGEKAGFWVTIKDASWGFVPRAAATADSAIRVDDMAF